MKELSRQSLTSIHDVIHGQNYVNIKARLNQLLPLEYANVFSNIKLFGQSGVWCGDDNISYLNYETATSDEKEEMAIWLEECKTYVCKSLEVAMPYVNSLFIIPSQEQIFWYRNEKDEIRVTLTQWGFENKSFGSKVDVIGMLIQAPRKLIQQEVTVHIDYSDGHAASSIPFILNSFNNERQVETDDKGDFYLGKIFAGKLFSVESVDRNIHYDFTVAPETIYHVVFDYFANYTISIETPSGEREPDFPLVVNGKQVQTDDNGVYSGDAKLLPDTYIDVEVDNVHYSFELERDAEQNHFVVKINKEEPVPSTPLQPPTPPQPIAPPLPPSSPVEEFVTITLLDYDGKPLPNLSFQITSSKGSAIEAQTNSEGIAKINKIKLSPKDKYKIGFVVSGAYRKQLDKIRNSDGK